MIIAANVVEQLRSQLEGKRVVFADGTFDLFHLGHVESFRNLRTFGEVVVIGVMSDEWVKSKKGEKRPILPEEERLELVDSIRYVDYTVLLKDECTGKRIPTSVLITKLQPAVFVSIDRNWESRHEELQSLGVELKIIPRTHESSTTKLLARIQRSFT